MLDKLPPSRVFDRDPEAWTPEAKIEAKHYLLKSIERARKARRGLHETPDEPERSADEPSNETP